MAGYKCVNFVDLCRLCAGSGGGGKTGIFSEEGKRKNMLSKINATLTLKIHEKDRLPKGVCTRCVRQLDAHVEFRDAVQRAQDMLQSCLNSTKLKNGGMVYIKDDSSGKDGTSSATDTIPEPIKPAEIVAPPQLQPLPTLQTMPPPLPPLQAKTQPPAPVVTTTSAPPAMTPIIINSLPKGFVQTSTTGGGVPTATIMAPNADFLNSIMQAVAAQSAANTSGEVQQEVVQQQQSQQQQQQQQMAQYTITLDGQTIKANQIHYKIQDSNQTFVTGGIAGEAEQQQQQQQQQTNYTQMDEFLKLKTPVKIERKDPVTPESVTKKPKFSVLIKSPATSQQQQQQQQPQPTLIATSTPTKQPTMVTSSTPLNITGSPISITPISSTASMTSFGGSPINSGATVAASPVKSIPVTLDAKMLTGGQGNKACMLPIMLKTDAGGEQIALVPTGGMGDVAKSVVPSVQYVQMKLQPGPDGMFRLAPAQMPPALTLTPQGLQQFGIQPLQQQSQQSQQQQQQQQIQIQTPQQIQGQLTAMPSVQVPLSNYLSLVEKSGQTAQVEPNLVITSQPVQQQPPPQQQQQQLPTQPQVVQQQPTPQLQVVQRSQPQQQVKPKPQKPNPPASQPTATKRRESSEEHLLNSSTESIGAGSLTAQSIAATQQMKAISALSIKQDSAGHHHDVTSSTGTGTGSTSGSSGSAGVSFTACDVCSKTFKRKEHLMQHLKSHVGLRPFRCEEQGCSKSFSRKEHLMRHIVSHTGKKLFSCPVCRKYFSRKDNLNKHKKTHVDNNSSAPFHCSICSKGFYMKGQFLKHKQMHESGEIGAHKVVKKVQTKEKSAPVSSQQQQQPQPQIRLQQQQQHHQQQQSQPAQQSQQQQQQPPPQQQQQQQQQQQHQTIQIQQQPITIQQTNLQPTTVTLQQVTQQQQQQVQQQHQIFTIPAHQLQQINNKAGGQIIQIAMPTSMIQQHQQQQQHTIQTTSLAGLATTSGTTTTKAAIIKSADGSTATVYNIPSNFIIDGTQFLSAAAASATSSREVLSNVKIEQIT